MREDHTIDLSKLTETEATLRLEASLTQREPGEVWTTRFAASGKGGKISGARLTADSTGHVATSGAKSIG